MADLTRLAGLRARGWHGVLPAERRDGQDFLVDAELELDLGPAAAADDLARTVDYGALAGQLVAVVAGPPVELIETLAVRLVASCLADPRVRTATVTVHKPAAPIPHPFDDVAVVLRRHQAVLSLGSNLGDRLGHLQAGVQALRAQLPVLATSPVYETAPVGGPAQGPYLNMVVRAAVPDAASALAAGQAAETAQGRVRTERFGPRTLDVDVVAVADLRCADADVTVPHPRAHERAFVLVPWLALDPDAVLPGRGPVAALLAQVDQAGVRRVPLTVG